MVFLIVYFFNYNKREKELKEKLYFVLKLKCKAKTILFVIFVHEIVAAPKDKIAPRYAL